jgi:hypothetical protein
MLPYPLGEHGGPFQEAAPGLNRLEYHIIVLYRDEARE